jgi:hypothetical protein
MQKTRKLRWGMHHQREQARTQERRRSRREFINLLLAALGVLPVIKDVVAWLSTAPAPRVITRQ